MEKIEKLYFFVNRHFKDINPIICGQERCEKEHRYGPAQRDYYLFHYILSGEGRLFSSGKEHKVKKGQLFIIRPGETTTYEAGEKDPWHYCWIGFDCRIQIGSWIKNDVVDASSCEHIFRDVLESVEHMEDKALYLCGKLYDLISALTEIQSGKERGDTAKEYILKAKSFMEANFIRPIYIEDIARSLNLNRSYFSTLFKKETGKSPQQYLVDFRLKKAAELLSRERLSLKEAAGSCGYTDIYAFSKMFKKRYGISPGRYMEKNVKNT